MDEEMQDSQPELKSELIKPGPGHQSQSSPWSSGLFYLIGAVVLLTLIAVIATRLPWYVLPVVIIGSLLVLVVVGALQLRQDQRLSQKNFLTLMIESFKRLPLLRAGGPAQEQPKRRRTRKTK